MKIEDVEGIGPVYRDKLQAANVRTTEALLMAGRTPQGRQRLAEQAGIGETLVLAWVNHADLMRIDGVGSEFADLLEAAGVDTVVELARRNPANLAQAMEELNEAKQITRRVPSEKVVSGWIDEAKRLERMVEY